MYSVGVGIPTGIEYSIPLSSTMTRNLDRARSGVVWYLRSRSNNILPRKQSQAEYPLLLRRTYGNDMRLSTVFATSTTVVMSYKVVSWLRSESSNLLAQREIHRIL
jgi:hypothetical protein